MYCSTVLGKSSFFFVVVCFLLYVFCRRIIHNLLILSVHVREGNSSGHFVVLCHSADNFDFDHFFDFQPL